MSAVWTHVWGDEEGGRTFEVGFDLRSWMLGVEYGRAGGFGEHHDDRVLRVRVGPFFAVHLRIIEVAR